RVLRVRVGPGGGVAGSATGGPSALAGGLDRSVKLGGPGSPGGRPPLADGGPTVVFCVRDRGSAHVYAVPADGSAAPRPVLTGAGRVVSGLSAAAGKIAVALATPDSYGEIVVADLASGAEAVVTAHGASLGDTELYVRQAREFAISDGTTVHGWLVRAPGTAGPGPVLLDVHGGPHSAWNASADPVRLYHQALAEHGWTVVLINPRGSDGWGEE